MPLLILSSCTSPYGRTLVVHTSVLPRSVFYSYHARSSLSSHPRSTCAPHVPHRDRPPDVTLCSRALPARACPCVQSWGEVLPFLHTATKATLARTIATFLLFLCHCSPTQLSSIPLLVSSHFLHLVLLPLLLLPLCSSWVIKRASQI